MRKALRSLFVASFVAAAAAFGTGAAGAVLTSTDLPAVQSISPRPGQVMGIAAPVTVQFASAVTDRAKAERTVDVRAGNALAGHITWLDDRQMMWQPDNFLPTSSPITVSAAGQHLKFATNGGTTADADMSAHTFTVWINGVARTMPASMGKPGRETPVGTFPVLSHERSVTFDSRTIGIPLSSPEGYLITGEFAERLTWGGVYFHSAPWSVDSQGVANVSHGCINLAPADAEWYYDNVSIGDPVTTHW
ncbi:L,D-transpeptidase [Nocardia seriolae]|uniref:L,D-transpeptidase n=2 Tax=Nocardia seriolae TaxID=37332 RepID=UPI000519FE31|nr:L,D-transpeptidase [Nocardia seriolae]MTJ63379.1 L,D-transpeptidase family protein [Nocardia seriolae]MTJ70219.1 L,D-transpeptidase family protein [Nocardia seriolae]MTJ88818.1 L,D-transpeptidase family protein [Nocardia seriolae]MTK32800.1 L,D-transpeptidase family protein [Nocardia seriolae]MTK41278.1 L,D-transpeptidase family protein [Nocardia seriolae]